MYSTIGAYVLTGELPPLRGEARAFRARRLSGAEVGGVVRLAILPLGAAEAPSVLEPWLRDAERRRSVMSPMVSKTLEISVHEGVVFETSEATDGLSLGGLLAAYRHQGRGVPFALAVGIIADLGAALEALHAAGEVAGSLELDDILLGIDGSLQVHRMSPPLPGDAPTEQAPEILNGRTPDPRTDLWALGRLFREMLSTEDGGKPKVRGRHAEATRDLLVGLLAPSRRRRFSFVEARERIDAMRRELGDVSLPMARGEVAVRAHVDVPEDADMDSLLEAYQGRPEQTTFFSAERGRSDAGRGRGEHSANTVVDQRSGASNAEPRAERDSGIRRRSQSGEARSDAASALDVSDLATEAAEVVGLESYRQELASGRVDVPGDVEDSGDFVESSLELHVDDEMSVRAAIESSTPASALPIQIGHPKPRPLASAHSRDFGADVETDPEGRQRRSSTEVWADDEAGLDDSERAEELDRDSTMVLEGDRRPAPKLAAPRVDVLKRPEVDPESTMLIDENEVGAAIAAVAARLEASMEGGVFGSSHGDFEAEVTADFPGREPQATAVTTHASLLSIAEEMLGTLIIDSPTDAQTFVNGEARGRGAIVLDGVDRFREFHVRVHRRGYRPWIASVSLNGQPAARVFPEFIPAR